MSTPDPLQQFRSFSKTHQLDGCTVTKKNFPIKMSPTSKTCRSRFSSFISCEAPMLFFNQSIISTRVRFRNFCPEHFSTRPRFRSSVAVAVLQRANAADDENWMLGKKCPLHFLSVKMSARGDTRVCVCVSALVCGCAHGCVCERERERESTTFLVAPSRCDEEW